MLFRSIAQGDAAGAVALLGPYVEPSLEGGMPYFTATAGLVLVSARRRIREHDRALSLIDKLSETIASLGNAWMVAQLGIERGLVALESGDVGTAEKCIRSSLATFVEKDQYPDVSRTLDAAGLVANSAGRGDQAVRCFAAAQALRTTLGLVALPPDVETVSDVCDSLRTSLGAQRFTEAWDIGSSASAEDVATILGE